VDITNIGIFLRTVRKGAGLTQGDVADRLGISAQAVSKWERGENLPDVAFFPDLSKILGVGIDEILSAGRVADEDLGEDMQSLKKSVDGNLFEKILQKVKSAKTVDNLNIDLDFFIYLTVGQKSTIIQALLAMEDYDLALDEILPYANAAHRNDIITHILEKRDYNMLEQLSTYMSNDMKAVAVTKLLSEGRYDIIEDNMPAFTRKHHDIIVDFIGLNIPDAEIIENFIPFFDKNQRKRLRDSLN